MTSFASTAQLRAFRPLGNNKTVSIVTTTSGQTLAIPDLLGTRAVRVVNSGTDISFIELAGSGIAAGPSSSMPLLANTTSIFTLGNDQTTLRVIGVAGGNTVYVTYGEGL